MAKNPDMELRFALWMIVAFEPYGNARPDAVLDRDFDPAIGQSFAEWRQQVIRCESIGSR
jgi:hypothetical protein